MVFIVQSTAGLITFNNGAGYRPSVMLRAAIGTSAVISRPLRSVMPSMLGFAGPVIDF